LLPRRPHKQLDRRPYVVCESRCKTALPASCFVTDRRNCEVFAQLQRPNRSRFARRSAARVITGTRKFDRGLGQILHDQLHWLDVPDRVFFRLAVTVHQCLNGRAPLYLSEHCIPVSSADTRPHLRSVNGHLLAVPRFRLSTYGRRAFSVAGPMAWNSLPKFYPGSNEQHRLF